MMARQLARTTCNSRCSTDDTGRDHMRRLAFALLGAQLTIAGALLLQSDRVVGRGLTYGVLALLIVGIAVGVYAAAAPLPSRDGTTA